LRSVPGNLLPDTKNVLKKHSKLNFCIGQKHLLSNLTYKHQILQVMAKTFLFQFFLSESWANTFDSVLIASYASWNNLLSTMPPNPPFHGWIQFPSKARWTSLRNNVKSRVSGPNDSNHNVFSLDEQF
jgi:hypothetical protein